jgi:hypothetical protein
MPENTVDANVNDSDRQKLIRNPNERGAVDALAYRAKKQPADNSTMVDTAAKSNDETASLGEHSSFKAMVGKLERKGEPEHEAKAVAATIGDAKYGKDRMEKAARLHEPVTQVHEGFGGFHSSAHLQNWYLTGQR